jgi:dolichyl-phosphate mannosyltransferase polypeptide 2 regulatory subunit
MQAVTDKVLGLTMLAVAAVIFTYYTLWVIITVSYQRLSCRSSPAPRPAPSPVLDPPSFLLQPFVDADHPLQAYFPERKYAIMVPTIALVSVFAVAGTFIGMVMINSGKKQK